MRIAVASVNGNVTDHFGYCEGFIVFEEKDQKIINQYTIQNPGHRPGFLPNFLHEQGVNTIITGGMGGRAIDLFNKNNIEVIIGALGSALEVAMEYIHGNLKSTGSICHQHMHHGECGE